MGSLARVWQERKVLRLLVKRDLRVRYSQSFLGYLWTIIDPLANALVYFMLFVVIFQRKDAGHEPYFLFLLAKVLQAFIFYMLALIYLKGAMEPAH